MSKRTKRNGILLAMFLAVSLLVAVKATRSELPICIDYQDTHCGLVCDWIGNESWCLEPWELRRCCWESPGSCGESWSCDYCDCLLGIPEGSF